MSARIKQCLPRVIVHGLGKTRFSAAQGLAALLATFSFLVALVTLIAYPLELADFLRPLHAQAVHPFTALCAILLAVCVVLTANRARLFINTICTAVLLFVATQGLRPDFLYLTLGSQNVIRSLFSTQSPMSTNSAFCLALLSVSLLLRKYRQSVLSQGLAVAAYGFPAVSLLGHMLSVPIFHAQMSLVAAMMLMPLSMASALRTAHRGILRALLRPNRISALTSRYVASALLVPYLIGFGIIEIGSDAADVSFVALIVLCSQTLGFLVSLQALSIGHLVRHNTILRRRAEQQAQRDGLTGAMNRTCFTNLATRVIGERRQQKTCVSLLFVDIDHFKSINDNYGHQAGDQVLKRFIRLSRAGLRQGDTVARWGGEEFVILLPATDRVSALRIAEKIRRRIELERFDEIATNLKMTVSIGCAEMLDGEGIDRLVARADAALYDAKHRGRNQTVAA